MVTVCEKDQCAGCMACLEVCSKNAINIKDSIKSYNAKLFDSQCCVLGFISPLERVQRVCESV